MSHPLCNKLNMNFCTTFLQNKISSSNRFRANPPAGALSSSFSGTQWSSRGGQPTYAKVPFKSLLARTRKHRSGCPCYSFGAHVSKHANARVVSDRIGIGRSARARAKYASRGKVHKLRAEELHAAQKLARKKAKPPNLTRARAMTYGPLKLS